MSALSLSVAGRCATSEASLRLSVGQAAALPALLALYRRGMPGGRSESS